VLVDRTLLFDLTDPTSAAANARDAAEAGYSRLYAPETAHDPFLPLALAAGALDAEHEIDLGTNIAVAFARSPMTTAKTAHDLQTLTGGRFVLGLGSQVKGHITRRFSMPWSRPAARMREYILALRTIWDTWEIGSKLDFEGEFYTHTLTAPMFNPAPHGHGAPKVLLAAVGSGMAEVAGEVADGLLCHAFTTASYIRDVTLPAVRAGQARSGRADLPFDLGMPLLLASGPAGVDLQPQVERIRAQLAFYASTPAYLGVLEHHGWGDLHAELHTLSREGRWTEMAGLLPDEVVQEFAVVAQADELADVILARYGDLLTSVNMNVDHVEDPDTWLPVIERLRSTP
jgi:probable F420-dependent oxidoreductase